jgi:hypothetical protein
LWRKEKTEEKKMTLERIIHRMFMKKGSREDGKDREELESVTYFKIPGAS